MMKEDRCRIDVSYASIWMSGKASEQSAMGSCEQRQPVRESTYRPRSVSSLLMRFRAILCVKCGSEREERLQACSLDVVGWSWRGMSG